MEKDEQSDDRLFITGQAEIILKYQKVQDRAKINWAEYNYPPLLKVMHFSLDELEGHTEIRAIVRQQWLSHVALFTISILNIISNIAQVSTIHKSGTGIRMLYTFLFFFIFNTLQTLWFYWAYQSVTDEKDLLRRVKFFGAILCILYLIFSIANFLNFDGWVRVGQCFVDGSGFAGVVGILESFIMTALFLYLGYFTYQIQKIGSLE